MEQQRFANGEAVRKILITGGTFNTANIRYMATLTGKKRPRLLYSRRPRPMLRQHGRMVQSRARRSTSSLWCRRASSRA